MNRECPNIPIVYSPYFRIFAVELVLNANEYVKYH